MNEIITVNQAFEMLKNAKITSSIEVFRRWLRQGKIENAEIISKKVGWKIPKDSLEKFITTQLNKSSNKTNEFEQGYIKGYKKALEEINGRDRKIAYQGFEERYSIRKVEVNDLLYSKNNKNIKEYINNNFFKKGVKNVRSSIVAFVVGNWVYFREIDVMMDISKFKELEEMKQDNMSTQSIITNAMIDMYRLKYIDEQRKLQEI